jgi:hypothetical protein
MMVSLLRTQGHGLLQVARPAQEMLPHQQQAQRALHYYRPDLPLAAASVDRTNQAWYPAVLIAV